MDIQYKVHHVSQGPTAVRSVVEGVEQISSVDCVEVQLAPERPRHGSLTLRFINDERGPAADLFTPDKIVTISIA